MSTTPIREALNRLQADGLVFTDSFRMTRVVPLNAEEARDIYESRAVLDPYAAQLSALRYSDDDAPRMKAAFEAFRNEPDSIELHYEFHRTLYGSCGNELLIALLDTVWARSNRYRRFGVAHLSLVPVEEHLREHEELLDLVLERDSEGVAEAMLTHVQRSLTTKTTEVLPATSTIVGRKP